MRFTPHQLSTQAEIDTSRFDLGVDERATLLGLVAQLNDIATDIERLLPEHSQTHWSQLRQVLVDVTCEIRRRYRWNRWS